MKANAQIVEKIKKLLKLGESPNKNEAESALLKARAMMAKYKIEVREIEEEEKLVEDRKTKIEYTSRRGKWVGPLANIIAKNHACLAYSEGSGQRYKISIIGHPNDVEICEIIINYAIDSVQSMMNAMKSKSKRLGFSGKEAGDYAEVYACGFLVGINEKYEEQNNKNQEWGLVMVVPQDVKESAPETRTKDVVFKKSRGSEKAYKRGYQDGKNFSTADRIEQNAWA